MTTPTPPKPIEADKTEIDADIIKTADDVCIAMNIPSTVDNCMPIIVALQAERLRGQSERDEARQIVREIHWMARRYAAGRRTYAPGMFNDAIRNAIDAGWLDENPAEGMFADDPSGLQTTSEGK